MPSPNPTLRREYKGAAAATTLQNSMTNSDTSFVLVAANNWPTGAVGKFVVCVNRGQADEEKILCDSQSSRTVSCLLANRGFDGTTAQGHAAGATVECTISAFDADEWNQHTNATAGVHGVAGAVVGTTDTQTLTNKTLTSPTINGSTISGGTISGTLAASGATLTSPTITGPTVQGRLVVNGGTTNYITVGGAPTLTESGLVWLATRGAGAPTDVSGSGGGAIFNSNGALYYTSPAGNTTLLAPN